MARVSFVIISHSHELAKGVVDLATQMAPDVHFEIAAGDDTGALGTSMHKVENALDRALAQVHKPGDEECCRGVLLMCDLGSATMVPRQPLNSGAIQKTACASMHHLLRAQLLQLLLHEADWDFVKLLQLPIRASSIWRAERAVNLDRSLA